MRKDEYWLYAGIVLVWYGRLCDEGVYFTASLVGTHDLGIRCSFLTSIFITFNEQNELVSGDLSITVVCITRSCPIFRPANE